MKKVVLFLVLIVMALLNSCNNDRLAIDISDVEIDFTVHRLDQNFLPLDTSHSSQFMEQLVNKYDGFFNFYLDTILQAGGVQNLEAFKFLAKEPIYPLVSEIQVGIDQLNPEIEDQLDKLKNAFKHLKYYFPNSQIPEIILYNSWFQYGLVSYKNYLGIGLDFFVADTALQRKYPPQFHSYIKADMKPEVIASKAMYAHIVNTIHPSRGNENTLLDNMILKGKQRYLLEASMPNQEEYIIMDYTPSELEWCYRKELAVWNELTKIQENNRASLFTERKIDINRWIQPGPFTAALSDEATDRMGEWIGLQMVRDFMRKKTEITLIEMLEKSSAEIMKYYNPKK